MRNGRKSRIGMVELRVQEDGVDQLVYTFESLAEATEIFNFIHEFFPTSKFVIQPVMH